MPEVNYGRIAILPKGDYNAGTQYEQGDVVSYNGGSYLAKRKVPVGTVPTNTGYWQVSSERGEKGDKGDTGGIGATGDKGADGITPHIGANGNWYSGDVDTGVKAQIATPRAALTIPTAGWTETGGYGEFTHKNVVRLDGVTVNDILSGQVTMETEVYAQNAHLSFQNQTANGTVTFYAERIPEGNIEVVYSLLKGMG